MVRSTTRRRKSSKASVHGWTFTAEDVRYTVSKDGATLYVIVMGWPDKPLELKSLGTDAKVRNIELLGNRETIRWKQSADALVIETTPKKPASEASVAAVYKISLVR
jgi:hypothetical protein